MRVKVPILYAKTVVVGHGTAVSCESRSVPVGAICASRALAPKLHSAAPDAQRAQQLLLAVLASIPDEAKRKFLDLN